MRDTIHALATVRGRAGVAIIRISGPAAFDICERLTGWKPFRRAMRLRNIVDLNGMMLDEALVLSFPDGRSFTGEPVVELHIHSGPAIIDAVTTAVEATGLSRAAQAGEFTHRAFLSGRMDLTSVQGLADALDAETEQQRVAAMRRLSGETGRRFSEWREALLHVASRLEATIDFADEDLPEDVADGLEERLDMVIEGLAGQLAAYDGARKLRQGYEVALIGEPNAGKSSLINYLSQRDVAIVSDIPGTTRDVVEARIDLGGRPVTFLDTAGLRTSEDAIEKIGIDRARERATQADLRIWLSETGDRDPTAEINVHTKIDRCERPICGLGVSTVSGAGVSQLLDLVKSKLDAKGGSNGDISRQYERDAFRAAHSSLTEARENMREAPVEIVLASLYEGVRGLDIVLGRIDVEDLLGEVFSSFCIGK